MWFKDFVQDLHYAWRLISRSRGFSAVIVLTLALGFGANTAVFGIIDSALLRPLPYKAPEQLIDVLTLVDASRAWLNYSKAMWIMTSSENMLVACSRWVRLPGRSLAQH